MPKKQTPKAPLKGGFFIFTQQWRQIVIFPRRHFFGDWDFSNWLPLESAILGEMLPHKNPNFFNPTG